MITLSTIKINIKVKECEVLNKFLKLKGRYHENWGFRPVFASKIPYLSQNTPLYAFGRIYWSPVAWVGWQSETDYSWTHF